MGVEDFFNASVRLSATRATVCRTLRPTNFRTRACGSAVQSCNAVTISILKFQADEKQFKSRSETNGAQTRPSEIHKVEDSFGSFVRLQTKIVSLGLAFVATAGCTYWPKAFGTRGYE